MNGNDPELGKLIEGPANRDAIHIAIAPVVAKEKLYPGQPCGKDGTSNNPVGIVDPFLKATVYPDQRFYLCLFPRTVTGMRHHWSHPAFDDDDFTQYAHVESEKWLREYADNYGADYDGMLEGAVNGTGYCFGDDSGPPDYTGRQDEFWQHIENVTGKSFDEDHRESTHFRCAC